MRLFCKNGQDDLYLSEPVHGIWKKLNPTWYPRNVRENRSKGLLSFIDNLTNDIKHELSRKQFWSNLSDAQRSALHGLATDEAIIIKPADKGGKLVIINRDDYEKECLSQLENTDFY